LRPAAAAADAAYRADGGDSDRWSVRAATVAGVRHRLDGRRGEDAWAWADSPGGLVVAVADGVSSTPEAALAAQVAVAAAVAVGIAPGALSAVCGVALGAAAEAVAAAVGEGGRGATTLVVAAVAPDGRWAAARVGDSDAFVLGASGWQAVFGPEGDDEVRSGATDALPALGALAAHHEGIFAPGHVLVLLSDGVGGPLRDGPSTVAVGLAQALVVPPSPLDLARLVDFARQGCHDDRTLLAVWPASYRGTPQILD